MNLFNYRVYHTAHESLSNIKQGNPNSTSKENMETWIVTFTTGSMAKIKEQPRYSGFKGSTHWQFKPHRIDRQQLSEWIKFPKTLSGYKTEKVNERVWTHK